MTTFPNPITTAYNGGPMPAHPTFGKLIRWQRSVNRRAALRLEGE